MEAPKMPGKEAFFVIIAGGSRLDLDECLLSLEECTSGDVKTIVVDNSTCGLSDHLARSFPDVSVIQPRTRLTFAQAANVGVRMALSRGARNVFLLNDDVTVHPEAFAMLEQAASKNGPGIYAPEIWPYEGRRQRMRFALDWKKRLAVRVPVEINGALTALDYAEGSAMLVSARVFDQIGFFDEAFGFYYEDADFSVRAAEEGFPIREVEGSRVWHKGSVSAGAGMSPFKCYYRARNTLRFAWKHRSRAHVLSIAAYHVATFLIPSLAASLASAVTGNRTAFETIGALSKGTWDFLAGNGKGYVPRVVPSIEDEFERLNLPHQAV
jgi:hypothetical protein